MNARMYRIRSIKAVTVDNIERCLSSGMIGQRTHKEVQNYIAGFKHDLEYHEEILLINGMDVSLRVDELELRAVCVDGAI